MRGEQPRGPWVRHRKQGLWSRFLQSSTTCLGIHRPETSNPLAHLRQFFTRSLPPVEKAELRAIVVHDAARCPFEPQSGLT